MAREAYEAIAAGLEDAIVLVKGAVSRGVAGEQPAGDLDVAAARRKAGLSQAEFASTSKAEQGNDREVGTGAATTDWSGSGAIESDRQESWQG